MPKSWREIEFLDYKERQVRKRSQKTRELEQVLAGGGPGERSRVTRIAVGGTCFLAALALGILMYQNMGRLGFLTAAARSMLRAGAVSGEVEVSSSTTAWEPLKPGTRLPAGTHVRTGKNGKATLYASLPQSRVVIFENSTLIFERIQLSNRATDSAALSFELEKGEAVFDFPAGVPVAKVVMPLVTVWSQLVRYKARVAKDENRVLVSRFAVQAEDRSDPGKKAVVAANQELFATIKEAVPKPRGAAGAALRERWE